MQIVKALCQGWFCGTKESSSINQARNFLLHQHQQDNITKNTLCFYPGKSMEFHEARKVMGDSFGGQTASEGSDLLNTFLEPMGLLADERTEDRQAINGYDLGFFSYSMVQKGGVIMGVRDHNGILQAVVVFREYRPEEERPSVLEKVSRFVTGIRAETQMSNDPLGTPALLKDKSQAKQLKSIMKKFEKVQPMMHGWHEEVGPKEPHWYVGIVASSPNGQGKGYCKEAMKMLGMAADECNVKCYLECAVENGPYYEKFGFKAVKDVSIVIDDISMDGFVMIREPKAGYE